MKIFHNTPGLFIPDSKIDDKPIISKESLYKLEDDYSQYRYDCNNGYCKSEQKIHDKYKSDIEELKRKLG